MPRASGRTFSVRAAAAYLGVRTEEIYRLLKGGKLEGHKMAQLGFGRGSSEEWVIPQAAIDKWKASSRRRRNNG